jgi:hypothetical protein
MRTKLKPKSNSRLGADNHHSTTWCSKETSAGTNSTGTSNSNHARVHARDQALTKGKRHSSCKDKQCNFKDEGQITRRRHQLSMAGRTMVYLEASTPTLRGTRPRRFLADDEDFIFHVGHNMLIASAIQMLTVIPSHSPKHAHDRTGRFGRTERPLNRSCSTVSLLPFLAYYLSGFPS